MEVAQKGSSFITENEEETLRPYSSIVIEASVMGRKLWDLFRDSRTSKQQSQMAGS